jgi:hypothetical protein
MAGHSTAYIAHLEEYDRIITNPVKLGKGNEDLSRAEILPWKHPLQNDKMKFLAFLSPETKPYGG